MVPGSKVKVIRKDSPLYGKIGVIQGVARQHVLEEYIILFDRQISEAYPYMATVVFPWDIEVMSRYDKTKNPEGDTITEQH
jgi:hypothetical protein